MDLISKYGSMVLNNYTSLLDWHMWVEVLSKPESWSLILSLAILECLLSADNALVLSAFVKPLPEKQQKKALLYGLWGAYLFRFILIGLGTLLIKLWFVKLIGALYLMYLSYTFFKNKVKGLSEEDKEKQVKGGLVKVFGLFWATVIGVELMDLSFSVDSILAGLAVSEKVWVVLLGGMIGILLMRGVATVFIILMNKVPELEFTAYILIAFISIKMLISLTGYEVPTMIFVGVLVVSFVITFIVHGMRKPKEESHQEEEQRPVA